MYLLITITTSMVYSIFRRVYVFVGFRIMYYLFENFLFDKFAGIVDKLAPFDYTMLL